MLAPPRHRYVSSDTSFGRYSLLSAWPPVVYAMHWLDEDGRLLYSMEPLFRYLRKERAYFLYMWPWRIDSAERAREVANLEHEHRRRYPGHEFVHLCNTAAQFTAFREQGLHALFSNHNCLVDERIFRPLPDIPRRFDAVYDARLTAYKRHELAVRIQSLALIYTVDAMVDSSEEIDRIRALLANAHWYNDDSTGAYRHLSAEEVNRRLAECRVGLCLSSVEGAMYVSAQYLLSGLPVVSTLSEGGRDQFFDDDYVLIVDDDPDAVAEAVDFLAGSSIAPEKIREGTLRRMRPHREQFTAAVQRIFDREGLGRNITAEWEKLFFDKLVRRQSHDVAIARIEAAQRIR